MSSLDEAIIQIYSSWPGYPGGDANLDDLHYLAQEIQRMLTQEANTLADAVEQ